MEYLLSKISKRGLERNDHCIDIVYGYCVDEVTLNRGLIRNKVNNGVSRKCKRHYDVKC